MIEKFTPEELEQIKRELMLLDKKSIVTIVYDDLDTKFVESVLINLPDVKLIHKKGDIIERFGTEIICEEDTYSIGNIGKYAIESIHRLIKISLGCYARNKKKMDNWILNNSGIFAKDITEARDMYMEIMEVVKKNFRPYKEEN